MTLLIMTTILSLLRGLHQNNQCHIYTTQCQALPKYRETGKQHVLCFPIEFTAHEGFLVQMSSLHGLPPPTGNKKPCTVRRVSTAQMPSPKCTQIGSLIKHHLLREAYLPPQSGTDPCCHHSPFPYPVPLTSSMVFTAVVTISHYSISLLPNLSF